MKYITVLCLLLLSCSKNKLPEIKVYKFDDYDLILSYDPSDVFKYYDVSHMHGLNLKDCLNHPNTSEDSYIAGWCNIAPNNEAKPFVYINLTRCTDDMHTTGILMHEFVHLYWLLNEEEILDSEEKVITQAEEEAYRIFQLVRDSQTAN